MSVPAATLLNTLWHIADYTPMATSGTNEFNQPVMLLGTQVNDIPCRLREANSRDIAEAQALGMQRVDYVVTLEASRDVKANGQLKNFTDLQTVSIHSGKLNINHVTTRKLLDQPIFSLCYCTKIKD